jgi:hypothetical protein
LIESRFPTGVPGNRFLEQWHEAAIVKPGSVWVGTEAHDSIFDSYDLFELTRCRSLLCFARKIEAAAAGFKKEALGEVSNFIQTPSGNERIFPESSHHLEVTPHAETSSGANGERHARFATLPQ